MVSTLEIDEAINWLHYNTDDWTRITEFWKLTSAVRINNYKQNLNQKLHEYFNEYPALKLPLGHELVSNFVLEICSCHSLMESWQFFKILIDFDCIYPDAKRFADEWSLLYKSVLNLGKTKKCAIIQNIIDTHITKNEHLNIFESM